MGIDRDNGSYCPARNSNGEWFESRKLELGKVAFKILGRENAETEEEKKEHVEYGKMGYQEFIAIYLRARIVYAKIL